MLAMTFDQIIIAAVVGTVIVLPVITGCIVVIIASIKKKE